MILLIILTLGTIGFWYWESKANWDIIFPSAMAILFSICLAMAVILLPIIRMNSRSFIEKFKSIKQTIEVQRGKSENIERFAFAKEIADANKELAETKFINSTIWDIYIVDEVEELTPIE